MEYLGFYILQVVYSEGVCLGENALCAVVGIVALFIFEKHRLTAGNDVYFDAALAYILHGSHFRGTDGGEQPESGVVKVGECVSHVEGCASRHIGFKTWCYYLVEGNVPYATYFRNHILF